MQPRTDPATRFWKHVDKSGACWLWTGARNSRGYGTFGLSGRPHVKNVLAHRFAYELLVGPIPDGAVLHHTCGNQLCVNPDHLRAVSPKECSYLGTATNATKTNCMRGHPFSAENTRIDGNGKRHCRECQRMLQARSEARRGIVRRRPQPRESSHA
jgi:hypothetical protein